ncbi:hypothetical protein Mal64_36640 [Pseudobythopirellula maris]|uniref:HAMP domain-containing protein n=1 Tax=Pseudobythopirellula maris TaxID=2527991 RepID=A0A5C5ZHL0_9BACT|nr:hypothetical protein [Pseudobythopirellula maris]TWT86834.1 hypothetical protein Mal64_36640 [Pseudobythopirellula maris]
MEPKKIRRKIEFVDREVQGALARRLIGHWFLFLAVVASVAFLLRWMSDPFKPVGEHAVEAWWSYGPMLLAIACLAPAFIYDSIRLSNRFAGPIYRLRTATHKLAEGGAPEKIEFRGADFWQELAVDFNRVVDRLAKSEQPSPDNDQQGAAS